MRKPDFRHRCGKCLRSDDDEDEDDGIARMTNLLELLDGTLVDTTALVDQVTGSGGLAGIDVADNDDVDVSLLLTVDNCQRRVRRSRDRSDAYPMVAVLSLTVVWFLVGTVVVVSLELRLVALRCVAWLPKMQDDGKKVMVMRRRSLKKKQARP